MRAVIRAVDLHDEAATEGTITLERTGHAVPDVMEDADIRIVPFHAGETLAWRLVD
mgnify:CR=1 FL=1